VFQTDLEVVVLGARILVSGEESDTSRMMFRQLNGWWLVVGEISLFKIQEQVCWRVEKGAYQLLQWLGVVDGDRVEIGKT
jgi:hypothetical protein